MSRRTSQLFSLSLLDLLTGALGAIIFLFIITPKGGESPKVDHQAVVYFDTLNMKLHGNLPDSFLQNRPGDTVLAVLVDYKDFPSQEKVIKKVFVEQKPEKKPVKKKSINQPPKKETAKVPVSKEVKKENKPASTKKETPKIVEVKKKDPPPFKGSPPAVPCMVSFEINWSDKADNVDLYICKGDDCVYGGRKKNRNIGYWDSGKSRNKLFGNDLRTNQEAVRQFDKIVPGVYQIYAALKESKKNNKSVSVNGLIYTKNDKGQERGSSFSKTLTMGKERALIGTVILKSNGEYSFKLSSK